MGRFDTSGGLESDPGLVLMKKAFTLIELLVVIAIIAILAAILFPVFAQAKAAAKASASISNSKQISLGVIQYGADVDDVFVPGQIVTRETGAIDLGGAQWTFKPWPMLIDPYVKNTDIYRDPTGPEAANFSNLTRQQSVWSTTHYGLNAFNLAGLGVAGYVPKSMTEPANPADTILLTSKYAYSDWGTFSGVEVTGGTPTWIAVYNFVSMAPRGVVGGRNWGKGGSFDSQLKTVVSGRFTGGNALRASNNVVAAFTDGHVGKRAPGALAIGTPFRFDATGANQSVVGDITDATIDTTKYLWDTL